MTVLGVERLITKLNRIGPEASRRVDNALLASATEMKNLAVVQVQKSTGGGRRYKRGGRTHVASPPGAYPNTDTGELVSRYFAELRGALTAAWGNNAKHAIYLEFGTSRMRARPHIRPTFLALQSRATKRVDDALREALKVAHG